MSTQRIELGGCYEGKRIATGELERIQVVAKEEHSVIVAGPRGAREIWRNEDFLAWPKNRVISLYPDFDVEGLPMADVGGQR